MYRPIPGTLPQVYDVERRENQVGPKAVADAGLAARLVPRPRQLRDDGARRRDAARDPARHARLHGHALSLRLHRKRRRRPARRIQFAADRLLPDGTPLKAGERLVQGDYAEALTLIAQQGEGALHGGPLGDLLVECMERTGGFISRKDLTDYRVVERAPIRGRYRGWEILGPPPPAASGVHITQMLNILEGYDIAKLGFGTVETLHLLAEVLKIAFADRAEASGDPDFVKVPVERIISKAYADERRAGDRSRRAPGTGPAGCWRRKAPTPRISPSPTARATSSPRRRPSTACSARASSCPASAWCRTTTCRTSIRGRATRCRSRRASGSPPRCRR